MTNAVFYFRGNLITGFELSGHTDDSGSDSARLVCAAVSSAAYMAVNTITDIIGDESDIELTDGHMRVRPNNPSAARVILDGFYLHIRELKEQYPHFIQINTEVQHDA